MPAREKEKVRPRIDDADAANYVDVAYAVDAADTAADDDAFTAADIIVFLVEEATGR